MLYNTKYLSYADSLLLVGQKETEREREVFNNTLTS